MSPKVNPEGTPEEWLRRAKGNLALAGQRKPKDAYWEDLCFEAQQGAEKAVKAVLLFRRIDFPKTHDIGELLAILGQSGQAVPQNLWGADDLSQYAVETRYPGLAEPVTRDEYRKALSLAQQVETRYPGPTEPVTRNEYRQAVVLAEQVVKWAENIISAK
jgi:HEPN domain-containing protein